MLLPSSPCCLISCIGMRAAFGSGLWLFNRWRAAWSHSCLDWVPAQFPYLHVILSFFPSVSRDLLLTWQSMIAGGNQTLTGGGTSITSPLAVTSIHEVKLNSLSLSCESYKTRDAQQLQKHVEWGATSEVVSLSFFRLWRRVDVAWWPWITLNEDSSLSTLCCSAINSEFVSVVWWVSSNNIFTVACCQWLTLMLIRSLYSRSFSVVCWNIVTTVSGNTLTCLILEF